MRNRIVKNIFSSWGMDFVVTVIRFFLTPLFIHQLGDTEYGIWILILSLVGYMELLNVGVNTANVRYLSRSFELKDRKAANEIFNSGLAIFLALACGVLVAGLAVSPALGYVFDFMKHSSVYRLVFIIAVVNLALDFTFYAFSAVLSARQKYLEVNAILTGLYIVRSLVAVGLLLAGYKLLAIVLNQLVFNLLKGLAIAVYSFRASPDLQISLRHINRASIKKIADFSVYIFIMNMSRKFNQHASPLIIGFFMSPGLVTYFSIAGNLITYLQNFINAIPNVLIPRFSQLEAANDIARIREYYLSFTRITLIISVPVVFLLVFYGKAFISLWIGPEYADLSGSVLAVLSVGALCQIFQTTTHSVLKATGRHKTLSYFTVLESTAILVLSLALIKPYGLIGLAYAQALAMAFFNLIAVPIYACRVLEINPVNYYARYLMNNLASLAPLLGLYYWVGAGAIDSILSLGIVASATVGVYLMTSYLFVLNMKERQMLALLVRFK